MRLRIKEERLKKEISQKELAIKIGISKAYLSELENHIKMPTTSTLFDIACALSICPKDLIECTEECKKRYMDKCKFKFCGGK